MHDAVALNSGGGGVRRKPGRCLIEECKDLILWKREQPLQGGGGFVRGEFRGEIFTVKKGGKFFPWRNFGATVP